MAVEKPARTKQHYCYRYDYHEHMMITYYRHKSLPSCCEGRHCVICSYSMAFLKLEYVVHEGRRVRRPLSSGRGFCFLAQMFYEGLVVSWFRGQDFLHRCFVSRVSAVAKAISSCVNLKYRLSTKSSVYKQ